MLIKMLVHILQEYKMIYILDKSFSNIGKKQKWLKENKFKHEPTIKTKGGYLFEFYDEEAAVAFKLKFLTE